MEGKTKLIRILLSSVIFGIGFFVKQPLWQNLIMAVACFLAGWDVMCEAGKGLFRREWLDEHFLMSIAAIGAFLISEGKEGAAVMILYQLGEWFQDLAVDRSRDSVSDLMKLRPDTARLEKDAQRISPEQIQIGDRLLVLPGERIPVDALVVNGVSQMDESSLTGESLPRTVQAGSELYSGAVNLNAKLVITAIKPYESSTASRILELVEKAQQNKASTESLMTRFARIYTPVVCACALLLFGIPSLLSGEWRLWGYRALSFLVVSCPCAMVISVPLSFFGGIGLAGRKGILIKGGGAMENLAQTACVAFDKTGTLTEGSFQVQVVHPEKLRPDELLCIAAKAESASLHPIAQSILTADGHTHSADELEMAEELPGKGMRVRMKGKEVVVGNESLMQTLGISVPNCPHEGTVVHIVQKGEYLGHIVINDKLRPRIGETLSLLRKKGVKRMLVLSGDRQESVDQLTEQFGFEAGYGGLLPQEKVHIVEEAISHCQKNEKLVFVGDGINDAPVLTCADVGVAMGGLGSEAAMEAADVVLMNDDLIKLPEAITISRRTVHIAKENLWLPLIAKIILLILSAFGIGNLWLAVFGDVGITLLAALNALRTMNSGKQENPIS